MTDQPKPCPICGDACGCESRSRREFQNARREFVDAVFTMLRVPQAVGWLSKRLAQFK